MNVRFLPVLGMMLALTACGGGGSAPTPSGIAPVTQSIATAGQTANSAFVVPLSAAVAQSAGIASTSFTLPVTLPANTVISANTAQPSNILTPFRDSRRTLSNRFEQANSIPAATARLYFAIQTPSNLVLNGNYAFSFTLVDAPISDGTYYIAAYDGANWIPNATGTAASINGKTLTFSGAFTAPVTLSAGTRYAFVLYTLPLTTADTISTVSSGTSPTIKGLIDGAVTLTLPLSTKSGRLRYTSTVVLPSGVSDLASENGITEVPGYITVTPLEDITFPAGQSIVLKHPYMQHQNDHQDINGATGGTSVEPTETATNTHHGSDKDPVLAVYNIAQQPAAWNRGFGKYASDGVTESLSYTLPIDVTLKAQTTYTFAVYQ